MEAFAADWLNLLLRWAHMIVGIAWIGASFHFVWLDFSLRKRAQMNPGVYGTSWMVHGGGFYHVEKYAVAPPALPPDLHWFKWEAYLTWFTGMALLAVQYYWQAETFLIDRSVMDLSQGGAIALSLATLAGGWLIYDGLCRSPIGRNTPVLAVCVFGLILAATWAFEQMFSGRGAMIHVGAFVGTIMAANVFMVIIPNQRKLVAQLRKGEEPNAEYGRVGKQRSLHNNYLTLPVLLMMISNHYPMLIGHPYKWLVVGLIIVLGAMIRHYINRHDAGDDFQRFAWTMPAAAVALLGALFVTWPKPIETTGAAVSDARVLAITAAHCTQCHAARPTQDGFQEAPKGVRLETIAELEQYAPLILRQAVQSDVMPPGNMTEITPAERAELGAWLAARGE